LIGLLEAREGIGLGSVFGFPTAVTKMLDAKRLQISPSLVCRAKVGFDCGGVYRFSSLKNAAGPVFSAAGTMACPMPFVLVVTTSGAPSGTKLAGCKVSVLVTS
jgi:hypothetical protein